MSPVEATTAITATFLLMAIGVCTVILTLARTALEDEPVTVLTTENLTSSHLTPPHLTTPSHPTTPHLTNPSHLTTPHLTTPSHLTPPHLTTPSHLTPPQHPTTYPDVSTTWKPPSSKPLPQKHKEHTCWLRGRRGRPRKKARKRARHFRRKGRKHSRKGSDATGRRRRQKRIVQGEDAVRGQHPWMVMVLVKGRFVCGGSIIRSKYVLTAAHCLRPRYRPSTRKESFLSFYNASDVEIIAGKHYSVIDSGGSDVTSEQRVSVLRVIPHKKYDDTEKVAKHYDLAILKLSSALQWTAWVSPICLPKYRKKVHLPPHAFVVGWGSIQPRYRLNWIPKFPQVLQQLQMKLHGRKKCNRLMSFDYVKYMSPRQLCAVTVKTGISSVCNGDSGGPLFIEDGGDHHVQLGVLSWGYCAAEPGVPSFFTYLPRFVPWIERVTGG